MTFEFDNQVSRFFSACGQEGVVASDSFVDDAANFVRLRSDTGTDKRGMESLIRSFSTPDEFVAFKSAVERAPQALGRSFEEILRGELSGRDLGRAEGIVVSLQRGKDYYLGKAYGPLGGVVERQKIINKLTPYLKELGLSETQLSSLSSNVLLVLLASTLSDNMKERLDNYAGHMDFGWFRQEQTRNYFDSAFATFLSSRERLLEKIRSGETLSARELSGLNRCMGRVYQEYDIFMFQEREGASQVDSSAQAGEAASYMVIGASVAIVTGGAALIGVTGVAATAGTGATAGAIWAAGTAGVEAGAVTWGGTAGATFIGGTIGTGIETGFKVGIAKYKKNEELTEESLKEMVKGSVVDSYGAALSLGVGQGLGIAARATGASILTHPVGRGIIMNEMVATGNAGLAYGVYGESDFNWADMAVAGVSGYVGGRAEPFLNRATELPFEMTREFGENVVTDQAKYGNVTTEKTIQSAGGALTELAGSSGKVFEGKKLSGSHTTDKATIPSGKTSLAEGEETTPLKKVTITPGEDLKEKDFSNCDLSDCNLEGANLFRVNLTGAKLPQSLKRVRLRWCNLSACDLSHCNLEEVDLSYANFAKTKLPQNLRGVRLWGCDLSGRDLSNHNLEGANLSHSNLAKTKLPQNLKGVRLWGNLSGRDLRNHNLEGADLSGANLTGAKLPQSLKRVNLRDCDLSGRDLSNHNLEGADLSGADLTDVQAPQHLPRGLIINIGTKLDYRHSHAVFHLAAIIYAPIAYAKRYGQASIDTTLKPGQQVLQAVESIGNRYPSLMPQELVALVRETTTNEQLQHYVLEAGLRASHERNGEALQSLGALGSYTSGIPLECIPQRFSSPNTTTDFYLALFEIGLMHDQAPFKGVTMEGDLLQDKNIQSFISFLYSFRNFMALYPEHSLDFVLEGDKAITGGNLGVCRRTSS